MALSELRSNLLDQFPAAAYICDGAGRLHYYNPRAVELWGRTPLCDEGGDRFCGALRLLHPDGTPLPHDQCLMAQALRTGQPVPGRKEILERPDGSRITVMVNIGLCRDQPELAGGALSIFDDISEQERLAEELRNNGDQLRGADRRKDEFLALLAHELRNPISAISSAVAVAQLSATVEHIEWSSAVIDRQVKQLSRLVEDLFDVSRITCGKIQLRKDLVEIGPILGRAVETVRPLIEDRKHKLSTAFRDALWANADAMRLEQIVVNLLSNAAKYTESGGRIWLTAVQLGAEVVIRVRDTGIGIAPEKLPRMFELFVQGDCSTARSQGGLGIGLMLVKNLVEMHDGTITASSGRRRKGSEFQVRLPASTRHPSERIAAPAARADEPHTACVLVVDDNADSAKGLARFLTLQGHDAHTAHNGPEAIAVAETIQPDVILLDIGLPGMDGYNVARRLRAGRPFQRLMIVAVSGYGQEDDQRRSHEAGFDFHLVKPIDHAALLTLLSKS